MMSWWLLCAGISGGAAFTFTGRWWLLRGGSEGDDATAAASAPVCVLDNRNMKGEMATWGPQRSSPA